MSGSRISRADCIADQLLEAIRNGKYENGTRLPSLRKLADRHNVSVSTARSAVQKLLNLNEIMVLHGSGYYIRKKSASGKKRHILIFNRPGDMYSAMLEDMLQFKSTHPDLYVTVESLNQPAERIQARIEQLISEGLDTIFLNSITLPHLDFIEQYLNRLDIYGFFHLPNMLTKLSFLPGVYSDWFHGGYIGLRHLADSGCRSVLLILSSQGALQQDCLDGAEAAVADLPCKVKLTSVYSIDLCNNHNFQIDELKNFLTQPDCGIFCFTHSSAFQVYDWLKSNGYRIPEDVKLLEYYDSTQSLEFSPPLSSISVCPNEISARLLKMFISRHRQYITVKPRLIKRKSTDCISSMNKNENSITREEKRNPA